MIQAITFDFWDTLVVSGSLGDVRLRLIQGALQQAGDRKVPDERILEAIVHAWHEWGRAWEKECYTFGAGAWVSLVLDGLGVSLAETEQAGLVRAVAASGMEAQPPLIAGVLDVLPRLAERYRLGVICDTGLSPGWMLRDLLESRGILDYFTHLTFSDELGVSKPHAKAFLSTLERLNAEPEAAVHIGDYPRTDIAGAKAVGMRAIRFTGSKDRGDGAVPADAQVVSYGDLEPLLARWN